MFFIEVLVKRKCVIRLLTPDLMLSVHTHVLMYLTRNHIQIFSVLHFFLLEYQYYVDEF